MKHNIKLPDGTIQTLDCKLGSGVLDKNGREIFEGDRVKFGNGETEPVTYEDGSFFVGDEGNLIDDFARNVEVVGHVEDTK